MRRLLALLSFLALALSPVAAPAASAAMAATAACRMGGAMDHHPGKAAPLSSAEPCCVAVPADLPAAVQLPDAPRPIAFLPVARAPRALGGAAPTFDDPPPKAALS